MKKSNSKASVSSKLIGEMNRLVGQATEKLGSVPRRTPKERSRSLKIRRGAHQVIPMIASLATKYGIEAPTVSGDKISSSFETAQALQTLLSNAELLHQTLIDANYGEQSAAWKGAMSLYGMLGKAADADPNIANELQPVKEWFKKRTKGTVPATTPTATPSATTPTTASAPAPVAAPVAAPAPAAVTTSAPVHVVTPVAVTPSTTPSPVATPAAPAVTPTAAS
jgi:hypothetical protein